MTEPLPIPGWTLDNADQIMYDTGSRNLTLEWVVVVNIILITNPCSPVYTVCTTSSAFTPNSNLEQNWILTNYFLTEAINIRIRIHCTTNMAIFIIDCREAIRAYYLDSEQNLTNVIPLLDQFQPADYSTNNIPSTGPGVIDFSFNKTQRGFFIGFLNDRPCVSITSILIYHFIIQCPAIPPTSTTLYSFPATPAPNSTQEPLLISPTCPGELDLPSSGRAECYANGTWRLPPPGERCECPVDTFQTQTHSCSSCPDRSSSLGQRGAQNCSCEEGWFRGEGEGVGVSCGQSPSAVQSLRIDRSSGVVAVWNLPSQLGNRNADSLSYRVCYGQSLSSGFDICEEVVETRYQLTGITPSFEYLLAVTSLNPVSTASGVFNTVNATFLSSFPNLTVPVYSNGYLNWSYSLYAREQYRFQIRYQSIETDSIVMTNVNPSFCRIVSGSNRMCSILISDLNVREPITISVLNPSNSFGDPISRTYELVTNEPEQLNILDFVFYLIIPLSLFVFLAILSIILTVCIVVLCKNRRPPKKHYSQEMDSDIPLQAQLYQDPSQYADLNNAVRALAKEIDPNDIERESMIGDGEFGDVWKGSLIRHERKIPVALKFLKPSPTPKNKDDFFKEASIMGQFCHPNVIFLYGVTLKKPIMIITPYMDNGSLDKYLVNNVYSLSIADQIALCCGVSRGMVYLTKKGYIHRDIAARNVLVDKDMTPKITDFGLSRFSEDNFYQVKTGGKIPVRWTAPEAIVYRKFNSASDVWSFGILMWEVMSFGQIPYGNAHNIELFDQIQDGMRLESPDRCPSVVYNLMTRCWNEAPDNRPSFEQLEQSLVQILEVNKVRPTSFNMKLSHQNPLNYVTLESWLASLKLDRYVLNFTTNGYTQLAHVWHLCEQDLFTIGIIPVGHRNKIMNSIHKANNQLCFTYSVPV